MNDFIKNHIVESCDSKKHDMTLKISMINMKAKICKTTVDNNNTNMRLYLSIFHPKDVHI